MKTETLTITLPEADVQRLRELVAEGAYVSSSEAIHYAIERLKDGADETREVRLKSLREKLASAAANPGRISNSELGRMLDDAAAKATAPGP